MTQVSVEGTNKTIGGTGSKGITAELQFTNTVAYQNNFSDGSDVLSLTITSKHGVAWKNYFTRVLEASGLSNTTDFVITSTLSTSGSNQGYYTVTVTIQDVAVFHHTRALVTLSVGELGMI